MGPLRRALVTLGVCLAALLLFPSGGANAQSASPADPSLVLTPSSGPVGTRVQISGQLQASQASLWIGLFERPGYFNLEWPNLPGCGDLIVDLGNPTISIEPTSMRVTGSFTVGSSGGCFQSNGLLHSTVPGSYLLIIGCHVCSVRSFTVTASGSTTTGSSLPSTGFHATAPIALASFLTATGLLLVATSRRNPLKHAGRSRHNARLHR